MKRALLAFLLSTCFLADVSGADYAPWKWSREIPAQIATHTPRSHRAPEEVDKFFHTPPYGRDIQQIVDFFGPPDDFSPQFMYSRTKGTAEPGKDGGTLRFLLDGGGELHVWTGNYRNVSLALRHRKTGNSELLYK